VSVCLCGLSNLGYLLQGTVCADSKRTAEGEINVIDIVQNKSADDAGCCCDDSYSEAVRLLAVICSKLSHMGNLSVVNCCFFFILVAVVLFCMAAVLFPIGFHMDQIGGEPYQLPSSYHVGISYIFFVLALWITVVSELFAGKVCLPHF